MLKTIWGVNMEAMFFLLSIGVAILIGNSYGMAYGFASFFCLFAIIIGVTSDGSRPDGR